MKEVKSTLTLEEKCRLFHGVGSWSTYSANGKVKAISLNDGPNGLRKYNEKKEKICATAMPTLSVVANSWSKECAFLNGKTIADECVQENVDLLLAPGVNIKRTPLNGRNFEYFSEDPYLSGILAKEFIDGVQEKGIGTSLKHICANNREFDRLCISSEIDERTLREIYLLPFEIALKAQPWTVMCAYNLINGVYASENKWLLTDILRGEFKFDGLIVSDWGAVRNSYKSLKAGIDLRMPVNDASDVELKDALDKNLITEQDIDTANERLFKLIEKTQNDKKKIEFTAKDRHENARKIAEEGIVLLKNNGVLPIKQGTFAMSGNNLDDPLIGGGGSANVATNFVQIPLKKLLEERLNGSARFVQCDTILKEDRYFAVHNIYENAYYNDGVILAVSGFQEGEQYDRQSIKLPKFTEDIIIKTAQINKNVIVLVYGGSAIDMSAWIDKVNAVVYCGYSGEAVNEAVANILTGKVCPSGKLAETFPLSIEDTFTQLEHGNGHVEWYNDGLFVGYRYYDQTNKEVLFPFGYGLSYASFEYSNLKIEKKSETDYIVSYDVTNTSDIDAKEISQVYVKDVFATVIRPQKELKGFSKDLIKAHQTKTVKIELDMRSFAYYSIPKKDWHVENGAFEIYVGASSRDIRLMGKIEIVLPDETQFSHIDKVLRTVYAD